MEFGHINSEDDDSNVLFDGDSSNRLIDPADSGLSLEDSCLTLHNPQNNSPQPVEVEQISTPALQYWQVPRESMHVLDLLTKYGFRITKTKKDPKKVMQYTAKIFGKITQAQIADYVGPYWNSPNEGDVLKVFCRYDTLGDFSQLNDVLELKSVLDANKYPYREFGKQEVLGKLNQEVKERSDLVKRLEGRQ